MPGPGSTYRFQLGKQGTSSLAWSEKRKAPRIGTRFESLVERAAIVVPKGQNRAVPALVVDVSRDGLGLVTLEPFERDSLARVIVDVSSEGAALGLKKFSATAVVRHCESVQNRGYKLGMMFKKSGSGRDLESWHDLIQRMSKQVI